MQIRIYKHEDGTRSVVCRRTRPKEGNTVAVVRIEEKDLPTALEWAVPQVRENKAPAGERPF